MGKNKYELINYHDVWNTEDGWDVNGLSRTGEFAYFEELDDEDVFNTLKEMRFLEPSVTKDQIDFWHDGGEIVEFYNMLTGEPLGRFEEVEEVESDG